MTQDTKSSTAPTALRMGGLEWALLLLLSVLWGGSFFFGKVAVAEMAPFTIVLCRVAIGAAILAVVVKFSGLTFPSSLGGWLPYLLMGLLNNVVPFSLIFWSQQYIEEGLASVLNAGTPLAGAVVAHFLTADEKLHSNRLVGVIIGIVGVAVLIGPSSLGIEPARLLGAVAVLIATLSYAFASVWGKRFRGTPALTSACCQLASSTLIMVPLVLAFDRPWTRPMPDTTTWAAVVSLAVFSTALAYVIFFTILRRAGAANVMLVTLLVPFTASILGVLFLNESVASTELAGAALVAAALLIIDGRPVAALRRVAEGRAAA